MSDVLFNQVSKRYGALTALETLDLEIKSGEFVSLLGPSGSGKTTTLNVLAGLIAADGGDVLIGGKRVNDLSPDKRDIAMVFQNYALYPHLTIFENIAFPLKAKGRRYTQSDITKKVEDVAQILGIEMLLARYPKELSGGQQQRVALGRGMVRDPKVFLLDEPLSNLDARLRIRMRRDIKALHDRIGSTIVYVTHDQAEALTMSTRIAVFDKGVLQQYATPHEIYRLPANMFVANFVGEREINYVPGRLVRKADALSFEADGFAIPLNGALTALGASHTGSVVLGCRTEGITIAAGAPEGIAAIVEQVELIGPQLVLYVRVGETSLSCSAEPSLNVARGDLVTITFDPAKLHFFDPLTTKSLAAGVTPVPVTPVS